MGPNDRCFYQPGEVSLWRYLQFGGFSLDAYSDLHQQPISYQIKFTERIGWALGTVIARMKAVRGSQGRSHQQNIDFFKKHMVKFESKLPGREEEGKQELKALLLEGSSWRCTLCLRVRYNNQLIEMLLSEQLQKARDQNKQLSVPAVNKVKRKRRKIIESHRSGSEESYEPQFNQYKIVGLPVDMRRVTTGSWGLQENKIYLDFLKTYKRDFENEVSRRKSTVFNRLSKALRKRTPDQCRSHHQKLQNRFKNNIDDIMEFVRGKIEKLGELGEVEEKGGKCKLGATGTTEWLQEEALVIDLAQLQLW